MAGYKAEMQQRAFSHSELAQPFVVNLHKNRPKTIFTAVETDLFYRAAQTLSMMMKGDQFKDGKNSKV